MTLHADVSPSPARPQLRALMKDALMRVRIACAGLVDACIERGEIDDHDIIVINRVANHAVKGMRADPRVVIDKKPDGFGFAYHVEF